MKIDNYNEFAANAIDAVYEALGKRPDGENYTAEARTAQMYAGSLFVICNANSAAKIKTKLIERLNCGVIVSKVGPEYSFDFI